MAYSYAQLEDIRVRVNRDLAAQQTQLEASKSQFTTIKNRLTSMESQYGGAGGWVDQIDALASSNPNDEAVQALKAAKDRLVSEFGITKTEAEALETAVNQV